MSREKMIPPQPPTKETPWERFERFAKKVIAAPRVAETPRRNRKKRRPT